MSSMNKPTPLGPKSRAALEAIVPLLERIQEDGSVDGDEIASLYAWRTTWRTVARRQPLRWFTDWLDQTLADGEVSPQELDELRATTEKLRDCLKSASEPTGDDWLAMSARPSWRADPSTRRQIEFLLDLGASEDQCRGLTKGAASDLIDALLTQRDGRRTNSPATRAATPALEVGQTPPGASRSPIGTVLFLLLFALAVGLATRC